MRRYDIRIDARLYTNGRGQMRVSCLTNRNEVSDLSFAPIDLLGSDRAAKQLVDEPNAVSVQDVAFAIASDFLDLASVDHFLYAAAVNSLRLPRQTQYLADFI